ncbi:hypothetical protein EVJ24_05185 [Exiguobacterium sp. SH1S21]|uniref:hypothetical protein n=1 Tax=Exiguobacterium sp. SH1S21 TaxID=2510953 RepID=UPI00103E932B|nr:hypothetical protein [Exiguobacterium sp. SH1S21]TCI56566.1 hypothetical protein EVJ24_05185 [Exiguobacterium sp. SH1S21]
MDAYERSLKQQAERIRRELSQEGKKSAPAPKPEPTGEFIPSDVPSPIYGYARPKPKINLPTEHSPETRDDLSINQSEPDIDPEPSTVVPVTKEIVVDEPVQATEPFVPDEVVVEVNESVESPFVVEETVSAEHQTVAEPSEPEAEETTISLETSDVNADESSVSEADNASDSSSDLKPLLGDVSILEDGFASVFMGSTHLKTSKIAVREEKEEAASADVSIEVTSVEEVAPVVEDVAKTLQTDTDEPFHAHDEAELTPAVNVSYKADSPPLNVMMTPQDRMAMYRSRRLAQKNNNL